MTAKELLLEKKRKRLKKFLKRRVGFKSEESVGRRLIESGFQEGWVVNVHAVNGSLNGHFRKSHVVLSVLIGSPGRWQLTTLRGDQVVFLPPKEGEEQWLSGF